MEHTHLVKGLDFALLEKVGLLTVHNFIIIHDEGRPTYCTRSHYYS